MQNTYETIGNPALPERSSSDHFVRSSSNQWSELDREIEQNHCKTHDGQEFGPSEDVNTGTIKKWSELDRGVNPRPPRSSLDQIWAELDRSWSELDRSGPNWTGSNWTAPAKMFRKLSFFNDSDRRLATDSMILEPKWSKWMKSAKSKQMG